MLSHLKKIVSDTFRYIKYQFSNHYQENKLEIYKCSTGISLFLWLWEMAKYNGVAENHLIDIEQFMYFHTMWFFLGVLSSVGLGTGLHTGILFLMPFLHRMNNVIYSSYTLDFDVYGKNAFQTNNETTHLLPPDSPQCLDDFNMSISLFIQLFIKYYSVIFWWAFGTAVGEIPPYLFSKACLQELDIVNNPKMKSMLDWMIDYLNRYGFWMILGFSSYPNMLFDMCGICCGLMNMKFLDFFVPLFIGKVIIKSGVQTMIWVFLSYPGNIDLFIQYSKETFPLYLHRFIENTLDTHHTLASAPNDTPDNTLDDTNTSLFSWIWNILIIVMCGKFTISILEHFSKKWDHVNNP